MIVNSIKRLFAQVTPMDRANFYTVQSLHEKLPRCEYTFTNCTDGFIALMERSTIKCWVDEKQKTVGMKMENPTRTKTIEYSGENLTNELVRLKKGEH